MRKATVWLIGVLLACSLVGCRPAQPPVAETVVSEPIDIVETIEPQSVQEEKTPEAEVVDLKSLPAYSGKAYVVVNNNAPFFTEAQSTTESFERYSNLDSLGRCGVAVACVGIDLMPTEERGSIGSVKPSGWHTVKYDNVDGKYLYNRCHLIGFQLSGENANVKNLITGTRYMNVEGMLPFENMIADYVKETRNHVLYRVTPVFEGRNLLATGVLMEALSMEDKGEGICFNVFCYNEQPGIIIDHSDGSSIIDPQPEAVTTPEVVPASYIGNKNSKKFHVPTCVSVTKMNESNKVYLNDTRDAIIADGYTPCGNCHP